MVIVIILCLIIIGGLVAVLILKKDHKNSSGYTSSTPWRSVINHSPVVLHEDYPWRGWRRYPRYYRRGIVPVAVPYTYFPQSMISETRLNECCDYEKCSAGLGCQWKGLDERWHTGSPGQCLSYRSCVNNSKKGNNMETHIKCAEKVSL